MLSLVYASMHSVSSMLYYDADRTLPAIQHPYGARKSCHILPRRTLYCITIFSHPISRHRPCNRPMSHSKRSKRSSSFMVLPERPPATLQHRYLSYVPIIVSLRHIFMVMDIHPIAVTIASPIIEKMSGIL